MSRIAHIFRTFVLRLLLAALFIELASFSIVSLTNVILYGHIREGSRAIYQPYGLFRQSPAIRSTTGNPPEAREDNTHVWMFGGSTMRGSTPDDNLTIPSLVAHRLNQTRDAGGYVLRNFGTNSFNSLLESMALQKELIDNPKPPRLVIFYDGANDAKYFVEFRTADAHHGYTKVRAIIESYYGSWLGFLKPVHAAIYASFTYELWGRLNQVLLPVAHDDPALAKMIEQTVRRYETIDRMSKAAGARFLLVWQPMRWTEDCGSGPVGAKAGEDLPAGALAQMADNFRTVYEPLRQRLTGKAFFVDFSQALCKREQTAYQVDGVHLTDDGRRMIAERLAVTIETALRDK